MAVSSTFFIDYGSGFVQIDPQDTDSLQLILRRELNPIIQRKFLTGSFTLIGTEATAARTHYITNLNDTADFKIEQNSVVVYEALARISGEDDEDNNKITFNQFETKDKYTDFLKIFKTRIKGENVFTLPGFGGFSVDRMTLQGLDPNCNFLQAYTWSGTNWVPAGNAFTITDVGRTTMDRIGTGIVMYDTHTLQLNRLAYSSPNWSISTSNTLNFQTGNAGLCAVTTTEVAFIDDNFNEFRIYQDVGATWNVTFSRVIDDVRFPSLAYLGANLVAMVDEGTKTLRTLNQAGSVYGTPLGLGEVRKPRIASLDTTNLIVAVVDAGTKMLRAFQYSGGTAGTWTQLGGSVNSTISFTPINEPSISFDPSGTSAPNFVVNIHDSYKGVLQRWNFDTTVNAWSQLGNDTGLTGGYTSALSHTTSVLAVIRSDSFVFRSRLSNNYSGYVNAIESQLREVGAESYVINDATSGSTIDMQKLVVGDMATLRRLFGLPFTEFESKYRYTLQELLTLCEMFQNYWYIEVGPVSGFDNEIKFTQPTSFSSFGVTLSVPSEYVTTLNQKTYSEEYTIDKEELIFNNESETPFVGDYLDYQRGTENIVENEFKVTTDFEFLKNNYIQLDKDANFGGLFFVYGEDTLSFQQFVIEAGTDPLSTTNVKNQELSKTRILDTYWKDYRYADRGSVLINGVSVPVSGFSTVRDILQYSDVESRLSELGLTEFPSEVAKLDWGSFTSYVTEFRMNLNSEIITISSIKLDL